MLALCRRPGLPEPVHVYLAVQRLHGSRINGVNLAVFFSASLYCPRRCGAIWRVLVWNDVGRQSIVLGPAAEPAKSIHVHPEIGQAVPPVGASPIYLGSPRQSGVTQVPGPGGSLCPWSALPVSGIRFDQQVPACLEGEILHPT